MILLDTNVLSETMRPDPERAVLSWLDDQDATSLYVTAVTEAEIRYGLAILPPGRRREELSAAAEQALGLYLLGRILPFDSAATRAYAEIAAARRATGRPISQADGQIAAIARAKGAALATRNTGDFEGCGLALIDPWRA